MRVYSQLIQRHFVRAASGAKGKLAPILRRAADATAAAHVRYPFRPVPADANAIPADHVLQEPEFADLLEA